MIWKIGELFGKIGFPTNSVGYAFSGGGGDGFISYFNPV